MKIGASVATECLQFLGLHCYDCFRRYLWPWQSQNKRHLLFFYASPGPCQVKQELSVWEDAKRGNREVLYKFL